MLGRLFNAYQVADLLGVGIDQVSDWVQQGHLSAEVISGSLRISEASLNTFLRAKGIDIERLFSQVSDGDSAAGGPQPQAQEAHDPPQEPAQPLLEAAPQPAVEAPQPPPAASEPSQPRQPAGHNPPQQVVEAILRDAVCRGAQAIVMESTAEGLGLRMRIDGVLQEKTKFRLRLPRALVPQVIERFRELAGVSAGDEWARSQFSFFVEGKEHRFDLSACGLADGQRLVIKVLTRQAPAIGLESLGLEPADRQEMAALLRRPSGLIVVTGPANSGRTRTIEAMARDLRGRACDVLALPATGRTIDGASNVRLPSGQLHSQAIQSLIEQQPDAIILPSVRDIGAVRGAIEAAASVLTVLVLPAGDFEEVMAMLTEAGTSAWDLSTALLAVIVQRKVRKLCPHCGKPAALDGETAADLRRLIGEAVARPQEPGCADCARTGFAGQAGIFHVVVSDASLRAAIRQGRPLREIVALGRARGSIAQAALAKVRQGATSLAELARAMPL